MEDKTYTLKKDSKLPNGTILKAGTKIQTVMGVVYIGDYPIPGTEQPTMVNWLNENSNLFK